MTSGRTGRCCRSSYKERFLLTKNIRDRLFSGAFWNFFGTVASRGFTILAGMMAARILGEELYGEVGVIQNSITMFQVLASFSVGLTCSKYVAELKETDPYNAGGIIGFSLIFSVCSGLIVGGAFFLFSPFLAENVLNRSDIVESLKISSVLLVLGAWNGVQTGTLSGFEAFRSQSITNFASGMITFLCIVGGAYIQKTNGVIIGMIIGLFSQCCFNSYIVRKYLTKYKISVHFCDLKKRLNLLYKFSMPAMLSGVTHWGSVWVGNVMLVNHHDGYVQMGIYSASYQWLGMMLFFPSIITNTILPIMSERKGVNDHDSMKNVLFFSIKISFKVLVPICFILMIFSPNIMKFYGNGFENSWPVLVVIVLMSLFACIQNMIGNTFAVLDKMWINLNLNILWCVLFVIIAFFLLDSGLGALGLAISGLVSYAIRFVFVILYSIRELKVGKI